ncbi:hypothetical protein PVK06_042800 [Gossypium arboreum]|uniref:Uncharacterized protein n=1 Tax=Gossypium arboreum TaxID=29729 RepID=A0ABR0MLZ3_GOSAR|nr:hypothetical protein PVK06_042800 [Gossypium arboreum]
MAANIVDECHRLSLTDTESSAIVLKGDVGAYLDSSCRLVCKLQKVRGPKLEEVISVLKLFWLFVGVVSPTVVFTSPTSSIPVLVVAASITTTAVGCSF